MHRLLPSLLLALLLNQANAQQLTLAWATEVLPANSRVKVAEGGGVYALGNGDNSAVIQRFSEAGAVLWTKTLSAPTLYAIDMDVDASNNIYIYVGFTTGQLDLDPGPNTTLVNPGKVYAKYNSNGQFQWGFSIANATDMSEDYGGISVDDAGNLYICGDLGEGIYDFDPGPGVYDLVCGDFTTGSYVARYRTDGTLVFANVRTWYGGSSNSRDIAVMRDGTSFYFIQQLDNGGPLSSQIDVDPGPGVFNVYNESQCLLRYDSTFAFMGEENTNFGDVRLCVDAAGAAYALAQSSIGAGVRVEKYTGPGPNLTQVYSTALFTNGNLRLGDVAPDEQGGCLGMYNNNCTASYIRFFKMNVSGLVDFNNLNLYSGTDCTMPGAKGFALRGGTIFMGTYNGNYVVDFEPGAAVLSLPTGNNDGVVARYDWCAGVPYDPFDIVYTAPLCHDDTVTFTVDAFGDASSYNWNMEVWEIVSGQGTGSVDVHVIGGGTIEVSVAATNSCGSSAPYFIIAESFSPEVELPDDELVCYSYAGTIGSFTCQDCTYAWEPGGETTPTLDIDIAQTTTYVLTATVGGCAVSDSMTITIDPCLGVEQVQVADVTLSPVPLTTGEALRVSGLRAQDVAHITSVDGRQHSIAAEATGNTVVIATNALAAGTYTLHAKDGRAWRFVVVR